MLDDLGIAFSELPVAVGFGRSAAQGDSDLREDLGRIIAAQVGRHLYRGLEASNIVVRDSQAVVERNPSE